MMVMKFAHVELTGQPESIGTQIVMISTLRPDRRGR